MSERAVGRRGNAAGRLRREQILARAAELFGANGFGATSFREIAAACDLTPAGLSHHFADKTAVLMALVRMREEQQRADLSLEDLEWSQWARAVERQNRENRVMTQLFAILSAEAIEPNHPAHDYFVARYRMLRERFAQFLCTHRRGLTVTDEDRTDAQVLIAMWDGLQLQSMLDPDTDTEAAFGRALDYVRDLGRNRGD